MSSLPGFYGLGHHKKSFSFPGICVKKSLPRSQDLHLFMVLQPMKNVGSLGIKASLVAQLVKKLPAMQETWV